MCVTENLSLGATEWFSGSKILLRLSPSCSPWWWWWGVGGGANVPRLWTRRLEEQNPVSRNPVSHKRNDLLLNRADLLSATLPSPPAGQGQVPDQDTGDKAREPQLSCWEISSVEDEI